MTIREQLLKELKALPPEVKIELAKRHRHRKIVEALIEKYKTKPNEQKGSTGIDQDGKEHQDKESPERASGSPGEANRADG